MPPAEAWAYIAAVCGAILAAAAVLTLTWRFLRVAGRATEFLDQALGGPGRPGLVDRVESIETILTAQGETLASQGDTLADHINWHADPGGRSARRSPVPPTNHGGRRRRPDL